MRIATWNVNSLKARISRVEEWLAYAKPNVLCMQETKLADADFPSGAFESLGYDWVHHGDGRWNGVAILSNVGLDDATRGFADAEGEMLEPRSVTATCGGVRVTSVYVPNGRALDNDHYQFKLAWFKRLQGELVLNHTPDDPIAICGDFNVAPTDIDVWSTKFFEGSTHVSEPERAAMRELEDWGLVDVFRLKHPEPDLYTFWDYRGGDFHKHHGMRIDMIYVSKAIADRVSFAIVDRQARKGEKPSDHAPVICDLTL